MDTRKNFQETDRPSFYTGRKIRKAVIEQPQNYQEDKTPETLQEHEEIRRQGETLHHNVPVRENRRVQETNEQIPHLSSLVINDQGRIQPKSQLVRSLERKLIGGYSSTLIGVFGINSDDVLNEALADVSQNNQGRIIMLPKTSLINNEFTMFAAVMYKFIETEFNRRDFYGRSSLSEISVKNQLLRYLQDISDSDYGDDSFVRLANLGLKLERGEKCKELLRFIKEQMDFRQTKFVWNIEIGLGEFNHSLLKNLSKIACDDLIIIVNSLRPLDFEEQMMGAEFGFGDSRQIGHQFLQKYFCFEDIIQADY